MAYVSVCFSQAGAKSVTEEGGAAAEPRGRRRMDFLKFVVATMNMAIAAEATGVWKFHAVMAHLRICLQIAGALFV